MKNLIDYQYSPSGNGEILLTIDGKEIGKVYEKEHAELIADAFVNDVDKYEESIRKLEKELDTQTTINANLVKRNEDIAKKIEAVLETIEATVNVSM